MIGQQMNLMKSTLLLLLTFLVCIFSENQYHHNLKDRGVFQIDKNPYFTQSEKEFFYLIFQPRGM
jgi:hypothetical protein